MGVFGFWDKDSISVYIINVYSPCDLVGKKVLWTDLINVLSSAKGNWCLLGDFNVIKNTHEWKGNKT